MVSVSSWETEKGVASLTDSEEEKSAFAIDQNAPPMSKLWYEKQYLRKHDEAMTSLSKLTQEIAEKFTT